MTVASAVPTIGRVPHAARRTRPKLPTAAWINPPNPDEKDLEMGHKVEPDRVSQSLTGSTRGKGSRG